MLRIGLPILALVLFSGLHCKSAVEPPQEVPRLVAPYPPALSETNLQRGEIAKTGEAIDPALHSIGAPAKGKRSTLKIPEPSSAAEMMARYRGRVPKASGSEVLLVHIPPERTDTPQGSLSLGGASSGRLLKGKKMPAEGSNHVILSRTLNRNTIYGTDEMVEALLSAAKYVGDRAPGTRLGVGNMSQPQGGDIPQSVSHNSGRDVDISFYSKSVQGEPRPPNWYVEYDAQGYAEDGSAVRFDAERNWLFIESLLLNQTIQVQYIFVADWLKNIMLDYGIRAGSDAEVIRRAEHVLMQPRDSSPHAEHFHIRLYCDLNDRLHGCHDSGKRHPWVESWDSAVEERIQRLIEAYQSGVQSERDAALRQLDLLRMQPENESPESGEEKL